MKPLGSTARGAATRGTCTPDGSCTPRTLTDQLHHAPDDGTGRVHPPLIPPLDALVTRSTRSTDSSGCGRGADSAGEDLPHLLVCLPV